MDVVHLGCNGEHMKRYGKITLLDLADVPHPEGVKYDGESLPDVLLGKSDSSRKQPLLFRRPPDRDSYYGDNDLPDLAIREGKWKFL